MRGEVKVAVGLWLSAAVLPTVASADPVATNAAAIAQFDAAVAATKAAMMADPQHALARARTAERLAASLPPAKSAIAAATAQWLEAEAMIGTNDTADASPIVEAAIRTVERQAPNSKLYGDLMRSRGAIAATAGRVQDALADYQHAHEIFRRASERRSQAIALQDIGGIYLDAGDYQRVLNYYAQSAEVFHDDPFLMLTTHNNRGEVLREMKRLPEAIVEFRAALIDARKVSSDLLETRILTNLALTQTDQGDLAGAERSVALALRLSAGGEAHSWRTFAYGAAARIAAARGNYAQAAALLEPTFAGVDLTKSEMPFKEFHQVAANVYEKLGRQSEALAHLRAFQRLDRQARDLSATTNAQLMAARFDFTNQNLKIANLTQGQLRRDIEIERQKTSFRTILFGGLLGVGALIFALLLAGYVSLRRSRNQVRAANDNLTVVNTHLEKALAAKTEFLATTSHEIRTPLNGILGMTQVLLTNAQIDGEVRDQIQVVQGAGETMRALVDDILDVAKMEKGEVEVVREEMNLAALLGQAIDLWKGQAAAKGVAVTYRRGATVPARIRSDETRLRQILNNLLSNAVKFTLEGSVELVSAVENGTDGETLVVQVIDTGIGIAPDKHDLIFEAFRQVDSGTSRQFGGTGLGLAICRRLAAAMQGSVTVESSLGQGATFTLRLPLDRVEESVVPDDGRHGLAAATVLVVERNVLSQYVMRAMLADVTRGVEIAAGGDAAIEAIGGGMVTHVLVDAASATVEDSDTLESLREIARVARAHEIACSILFVPDDVLNAASLTAIGATQLIAKPVDGASLIATLGAVYDDADAPRTAPAVLDRSAA